MTPDLMEEGSKTLLRAMNTPTRYSGLPVFST